MKSLFSSVSAVTGAFLLILFVFASLAAPWIAPYDARQISGEIWQPMSAAHWLGTDNLGRDLFSRLLSGARLTLSFAFVISVMATLAGTLLSFLAVSVGGAVEGILSRLNDLFMSLPSLIIALVALAVLPQTNSTLIVVLAAIGATRVYRLGYSLASHILATDYMEAAKLAGESHAYRVIREMLPNARFPLLAEWGMQFSASILFISTLSFIGLGIQPPAADWGAIVRENKDGILFGVSAAFYPAIAISLLVIAVNLLVDALSRKLQQQEDQ
ncbi:MULTISPECIES: ABC transporter permease [Rahnella]|jgi:peptide/nickel transport system permease protein|uniref:ABC transporter permease n=1 Tax=Rahnella variigena TaxID=574964 RepID=A0ABX9PPM6_9GAMM|nr:MULTISPECIES: ABC transporter permease [Rahnella]RJT50835.1 ABC transporter permease [Rahnella variigena]RKF66490.1 ABC transporter permease [Rahnella variigena]TCQ92041.1 peptide/nickel transport system permease protein [Rahnella sp. JUb53]